MRKTQARSLARRVILALIRACLLSSALAACGAPLPHDVALTDMRAARMAEREVADYRTGATIRLADPNSYFVRVDMDLQVHSSDDLPYPEMYVTHRGYLTHISFVTASGNAIAFYSPQLVPSTAWAIFVVYPDYTFHLDLPGASHELELP